MANLAERSSFFFREALTGDLRKEQLRWASWYPTSPVLSKGVFLIFYLAMELMKGGYEGEGRVGRREVDRRKKEKENGLLSSNNNNEKKKKVWLASLVFTAGFAG